MNIMKKHWKNYVKKTQCVCCDKEFYAYIYNLERGWGKFCSRECSKTGNTNRTGQTFTDEQKEKISQTLKKKFASGELVSPLRTLGLIGKSGSEAMNWRGGKSLEGQKFRNSAEYKEWRKKVLKMQDYTCQFCKKRGGTLEVDHVEEFSKYFDKRVDVMNGRVLCKDCHNRATRYNKNVDVELREAFIDVLMELAEQDKRIVIITCDVGFKFLEKFEEKYPDRYFNFGVTEQSSMLAATTMALSGLRPVFYSMINFVVFRPLEMLRNGACYHDAPIIIAGVSGSKAYGFLGLSHNITKNEDINLIWRFPNLRIRLPLTEEETKKSIKTSIQEGHPTYIRL